MKNSLLEAQAASFSQEMLANGCSIIPFPSHLAKAMKAHICRFVGIKAGEKAEDLELLEMLTEKVSFCSDEEYVQKFSKAMRMFPDSVALLAVKWVSSLATLLDGKQAGINYVSKKERSINPVLREDSYDVFWRCVRPKKPDVGLPHCDYQFWEIVKGTDEDVGVPFDYDERWKIWIPLMGCNSTNSLEVVLGSHREEVPIERVLTRNGYKPMIQEKWLEKKSFITPFVNFQDCCVLFHDKLVHQGPANHSSLLRISGELTILLKR